MLRRWLCVCIMFFSCFEILAESYTVNFNRGSLPINSTYNTILHEYTEGARTVSTIWWNNGSYRLRLVCYDNWGTSLRLESFKSGSEDYGIIASDIWQNSGVSGSSSYPWPVNISATIYGHFLSVNGTIVLNQSKTLTLQINVSGNNILSPHTVSWSGAGFSGGSSFSTVTGQFSDTKSFNIGQEPSGYQTLNIFIDGQSVSSGQINWSDYDSGQTLSYNLAVGMSFNPENPPEPIDDNENNAAEIEFDIPVDDPDQPPDTTPDPTTVDTSVTTKIPAVTGNAITDAINNSGYAVTDADIGGVHVGSVSVSDMDQSISEIFDSIKATGNSIFDKLNSMASTVSNVYIPTIGSSSSFSVGTFLGKPFIIDFSPYESGCSAFRGFCLYGLYLISVYQIFCGIKFFIGA